MNEQTDPQSPTQQPPVQQEAPPPQETTVQQPSPMTSGDIRQQIIANALLIYPKAVQQHHHNFPSIPVRAADIFEVCIADVTRKYGTPIGDRKYIAQLTRAHESIRTARVLLLRGAVMPTMDGALHDLLEKSADGVGYPLHDLLPEYEGRAHNVTGNEAG